MKLEYILSLADSALIIGHRISEWCGHGPILEQDIALTNTALDHLGRARSLYQYAAEQVNALPMDQRHNLFISYALNAAATTKPQVTEDDIAYLRDEWEFRNPLLTEQPNGDWAVTIARAFYYDTFNFYYFTELLKSKDAALAAVAEKSLKEITYHRRWSSEWVIRLGDGTEESHQRMKQAIEELWMFTGELFIPTEYENAMTALGVAPSLDNVKSQWMTSVAEVLREATLDVPTATWMQQGGKDGKHTEHAGYILAEFQHLQRAYPGMDW